MSNEEDFIIGIDLGTSNSVACVFIDGKPTLIPSSEGPNMYGASFPSYVAFTDETVIVGEKAKDRYKSHPNEVVCDVKREMGKDIKMEIKGKMYSPQEISAFILEKIKNDAETFLNKSVKNAVITVPAYFDDNQRTATKDAAEIVGLKAKIINEPTAASLAYGINDNREGLQRILVFDLGGGTFDVTIMEFGAGIFEVKSTSGDNQLGGRDMDYIISDYLAKEFEKQHGVKLNLDINKQLKNFLIDAAEKAKIDLSTHFETEINLPNMGMDANGNPLHLITTFNRTQLDDLVRPIIKRCEKPLQTALDDAGFAKKDINKLILVGGPTRMPIVRKFIENFMGLSGEKGIDPMACVAQGASIRGGVDSGAITVIQDIIDVIPLSLGIISESVFTEVIVERNTPVPINKSRKFKTTKDNQKIIKVQIVQGEFKMAKDNAYLGSFILDINPAPKGRVTVEISFNINKEGILNVTARDETTGNTKSKRLDSPNKMSESQILKAITDFKEHSKKDEETRIKEMAKIKAHDLIYDAKTIINNRSIGYADKSNIQDVIDSLEDALKTGNDTKIKIMSAKLRNTINKLIQ